VTEFAVMPEAVWASPAVAVLSTFHMHTRLVMGVAPLNENKPFKVTEVTASLTSWLGGFNDSMLGHVPSESVQLPSVY
jgi:hypothetical protein